MLTIVYIHYGLFITIQIIIWISVFFLSNFLIGINPISKEFQIIRILSIIVIIFILYYNSIQSIYLTSFIFPLSINKINYIDDFMDEDDPTSIIYFRDFIISWFYFFDFKEISDLLDCLDYDKAYIISFNLILDVSGYDLDQPSIILSKPILISKKSNPWLISRHLNEQVRIACESYNLDESCLKQGNESPAILIRYKEINLSFWIK
jgi:hypothetical protein